MIFTEVLAFYLTTVYTYLYRKVKSKTISYGREIPRDIFNVK